MAGVGGFREEAKAYGTATRYKSSGQANQFMLERVLEALTGNALPGEYQYQNCPITSGQLFALRNPTGTPQLTCRQYQLKVRMPEVTNVAQSSPAFAALPRSRGDQMRQQDIFVYQPTALYSIGTDSALHTVASAELFGLEEVLAFV